MPKIIVRLFIQKFAKVKRREEKEKDFEKKFFVRKTRFDFEMVLFLTQLFLPFSRA